MKSADNREHSKFAMFCKPVASGYRTACVVIVLLVLTMANPLLAGEPVPVLMQGEVMPLQLAAGEVATYAVPVAVGTTYTFDLSSTGHFEARVTDSGGDFVARFSSAYGMTVTADRDCVFTLSVANACENTVQGSIRVLAGALPL